MSKNSKIMIVFLIIFLGLSLFAISSVRVWKKTHFACDAQLITVEEEGAEDLIMHFRFVGKSGHLETKGVFTAKNGKATETSNKIEFSFWQDGDSLILISTETSQLPKISLPVLARAPDFFTSRERGIRLQMIRKNTSGYLFLYDGTPALYCKITD